MLALDGLRLCGKPVGRAKVGRWRCSGSDDGAGGDVRPPYPGGEAMVVMSRLHAHETCVE